MAQPTQAAYTQGYHESVTRGHAARTAEEFAAFVLPHLRPDSRILDVGCGPGSITNGFAKYVPDGSVVGVDVSETVLDQAKSQVKEGAENVGKVTYQVGNITDGLPFPDGSFDVVFCHQFLIHLPDPVSAMREMRRVCKPGGMVACREGDFGLVAFHPHHRGTELYREYYIKMLRGKGMEPFAGRNLHIWARDAGFDIEKIEKSVSSKLDATDAQRDWWGSVLLDRFRGSQLRDGFKAAGASDTDLEEIISGVEQWKQDPNGWAIMVNGEVICRR